MKARKKKEKKQNKMKKLFFNFYQTKPHKELASIMPMKSQQMQDTERGMAITLFSRCCTILPSGHVMKRQIFLMKICIHFFNSGWRRAYRCMRLHRPFIHSGLRILSLLHHWCMKFKAGMTSVKFPLDIKIWNGLTAVWVFSSVVCGGVWRRRPHGIPSDLDAEKANQKVLWTVKMDQLNDWWPANIVDAWQALLLLYLPVNILFVYPRPPMSFFQSFMAHVIVTQEENLDENPVLVSTLYDGHMCNMLTHYAIMVRAVSTPAQLVMQLPVVRPCAIRECKGVVDDRPVSWEQNRQWGEGQSINIDVDVPPGFPAGCSRIDVDRQTYVVAPEDEGDPSLLQRSIGIHKPFSKPHAKSNAHVSNPVVLCLDAALPVHSMQAADHQMSSISFQPSVPWEELIETAQIAFSSVPEGWEWNQQRCKRLHVLLSLPFPTKQFELYVDGAASNGRAGQQSLFCTLTRGCPRSKEFSLGFGRNCHLSPRMDRCRKLWLLLLSCPLPSLLSALPCANHSHSPLILPLVPELRKDAGSAKPITNWHRFFTGLARFHANGGQYLEVRGHRDAPWNDLAGR